MTEEKSSKQPEAATEETNSTRVAIACQGGGAQTAFTAGALSWLLKNYMHQDPSKPFRIVALSGTSGGAVCASLAWDDLLFSDERMVDGYEPTVKRFWFTGYPNGNAALSFPEAWAEDFREFREDGRLPWLHTVDRLRVELGMVGVQWPSVMVAATPFDVSFELKPYYFNRLFELVDVLTQPLLVNPMFDEIGRQLKALREMPVPGCRWTANLIGDILDLLPFHEKSVIRDGERAIIRRECDIQDAFRAVLKKFFTEEEVKRLRMKARGAKTMVPELLIGAADAERVQDASGNRLLRERRHETEPEPASESGLTAEQMEFAQRQIDLAKRRGLAIEEHPFHLASYTNFRTLRGSQDPDSIVDNVIASAAIPTVMRGIEKGHTTLWDGLYSSNPPICELPDVFGADDQNNPDEIWVIRINPTEISDRPDTPREIVDRRNELAGNLPLAQEIRDVIRIGGASKGNRYYRPITFGFIDMSEDQAAKLDYPTKLDKRLEPVAALFQDGERQMESFYRRWLAAA
jgi:hypothetical protein